MTQHDYADSAVESPRRVQPSAAAAVEESIVAIAVLILGAVLVIGAIGFRGGAGYQAVGPAIFPIIIGSVGIVCGGVLTFARVRVFLNVLRREKTSEKKVTVAGDTEREAIGWKGVALLAALLGGYAMLLVPVGFWQLTGLVFALAARIFGNKHIFRNLIIGYVIALTIYFTFDRLLGVGLPDGYIRIAG